MCTHQTHISNCVQPGLERMCAHSLKQLTI